MAVLQAGDAFRLFTGAAPHLDAIFADFAELVAAPASWLARDTGWCIVTVLLDRSDPEGPALSERHDQRRASRLSISPSTDGRTPSPINDKPPAACYAPSAITPRTRRSPWSSDRDSLCHNALSLY